MAVNLTDEVTFATGLTVATDGVTAAYGYGDVLPVATAPADQAVRASLRAAGALRTVEAATTVADFDAAALAQADAGEVQDGTRQPVLAGDGELPVIADY